MTEPMFRMLERIQRMDARLDALLARARARRFVDPFEIDRLKKRKQYLRHDLRVGLARLLSPYAAARTSA